MTRDEKERYAEAVWNAAPDDAEDAAWCLGSLFVEASKQADIGLEDAIAMVRQFYLDS